MIQLERILRDMKLAVSVLKRALLWCHRDEDSPSARLWHPPECQSWTWLHPESSNIVASGPPGRSINVSPDSRVLQADTPEGVCVCMQSHVRIIYLPLPKLAIVYKYRPVEPRVGITKGFPQSPHCSLASLVDWVPSCPAMVSRLCAFVRLFKKCCFNNAYLWLVYLL